MADPRPVESGAGEMRKDPPLIRTKSILHPGPFCAGFPVAQKVPLKTDFMCKACKAVQVGFVHKKSPTEKAGGAAPRPWSVAEFRYRL